MKLSIFKDNTFIIGVDYSKNENCIDVIDITEEEKIKLEKGCVIEKGKIVETSEYKEFIKQSEIQNIKKRYSDFIFARYSLTDQLNMSNEALMITVLAQAEQRIFTEAEFLRLQEIKEAKIWIDEQRELCKAEIENI